MKHSPSLRTGTATTVRNGLRTMNHWGIQIPLLSAVAAKYAIPGAEPLGNLGMDGATLLAKNVEEYVEWLPGLDDIANMVLGPEILDTMAYVAGKLQSIPPEEVMRDIQTVGTLGSVSFLIWISTLVLLMGGAKKPSSEMLINTVKHSVIASLSLLSAHTVTEAEPLLQQTRSLPIIPPTPFTLPFTFFGAAGGNVSQTLLDIIPSVRTMFYGIAGVSGAFAASNLFDLLKRSFGLEK